MSPMAPRVLTIEHALLGFLQQGPVHGYQLYRQLCNPAGLKQIWYLKQAQLYALLGKLEEAGYLTASIQQQETRPARRVFHLTQAGQEAFQNWLLSPVQRPRQMRQEFQAKLYFAQRQGGEAYHDLITSQHEVCRRWLAAQEKSIEQNGAGDFFVELVGRFRAGQIQAMLDWLDACQERLSLENAGQRILGTDLPD